MPTSPSLFGPPRPCAIATILNCEDTESLSSMQTLLHSIKATNNTNDENTNNNDENNIYKPEIITLVTGNISNEIRDEMLGCFCTRIIDIDNINAGNNNDYATNDNATGHNANLDVAKIHLFNQKVYEKILYIDSNCLVQKSVSHLFKLSNNNSSNNSDNNNNDNDNLGLVAANNNDNNYDNNQGFGSNVILIQPSNELYKDMMNQVHANLSTNQSTADFWNTYFHNTWNQIPKENKLGIEYNYYNNSNNNNNSDLKHEDICIWNYNHDSNNHSASISTRNKLYQKWYKKSHKENYREEQLLTQKAKHDSQLQQLKRKRQQQQKHMQQQLHQQQQLGATNNNHNNNPNETKKKQMEKHKLVTKRYKELRKEGKDPKESMRIARSDYGMDKDDERQQSPSAQVAKMFGMGGIV